MTNFRKQIEKVINESFPNKDYANHQIELLSQYAESGLTSPNLAAEIGTGDEGKLWSCIWEAMLWCHHCKLGYELRNLAGKAGQNGPDFCFDHQERAIWVEAIVPSPEGIPADWLKRPDGVSQQIPYEQMLLRCTSAIKAKRDKFIEYKKDGIVGANDHTVIAVNICRLSDWVFLGDGISRLPLMIEALFPIGPLAIPLTSEGKRDGPAQNIPRYTIKKQNGSDVPTDNFLNPDYSNVSAVIQAHQRDTKNPFFENDLALSVFHNPLADNPLPTGLFGARMEIVAERNGDEYLIRNIAAQPAALMAD